MFSIFLETLVSALRSARLTKEYVLTPARITDADARAMLCTITVCNPAGGYAQQPLFLAARSGADLLKGLRTSFGLAGKLRARHSGTALGYVPEEGGALWRGYPVYKIAAYDLGPAYDLATEAVLRAEAAHWNPADALPDSPEYGADEAALWASYADRLNN